MYRNRSGPLVEYAAGTACDAPSTVWPFGGKCCCTRCISAAAFGRASNSRLAWTGLPISSRSRAAAFVEMALDPDRIRMELVMVTVTSSIQYLNPPPLGWSKVSKFSPCRIPSGTINTLESFGIIATAGLIRTSYKDDADGVATCSGSEDFWMARWYSSTSDWICRCPGKVNRRVSCTVMAHKWL